MNLTTFLDQQKLVRDRQPQDFLRAVLAELARSYGVPAQAIALIEDCAAILGLHEFLPANQSSYLAGPLTSWSSHRDQPIKGRIVEVERLANAQRVHIVSGMAPANHLVGTAEIVCAMGNFQKDGPDAMPPEWYEVFVWASQDVVETLTPRELAGIKERENWPNITDAMVLTPGGSHNEAYIRIAMEIRQMAIKTQDNEEGRENIKRRLRPIALAYLNANTRVIAQARAQGADDVVKRLEHNNEQINRAYPGLKLDTEGGEGP